MDWREKHDRLREKQAKLRKDLLNNIRQQLPELKKLLEEVNHEGVYEQAVYRYYYGSFKIYSYQEYTQKIVEILEGLMPDIKLREFFYQVVNPGLNKKFTWDANEDWEGKALPILNAFLHSKHILEMLVKYGEELEDPETLPYGWATILLFYGLR